MSRRRAAVVSSCASTGKGARAGVDDAGTDSGDGDGDGDGSSTPGEWAFVDAEAAGLGGLDDG